MSNGYQNRQGGQRHGQQGNRHREPPPSMLDTGKIRFDPIDPELFNGIAKTTAKTVAADTRSNKPTQLRKFYDELCMWETKVNGDNERYQEFLPFIRMMNAKAAYAEGRKLVNHDYVTLLSHSLAQAGNAEQFRRCKLFLEAFMGFYKLERPRD